MNIDLICRIELKKTSPIYVTDEASMKKSCQIIKNKLLLLLNSTANNPDKI